MLVFEVVAGDVDLGCNVTYDATDFDVAAGFDRHRFVVAALGLFTTSPARTLGGDFHEFVGLA